jgi:uncharacterized protein (TIGR02271 family)
MFDSAAAASQARSRLMSAGFPGGSVTLTGETDETDEAGMSPSSSAQADRSRVEEPRQEGAISRFLSNIFGDGDDNGNGKGRDDDRAQAGYADTYKEAFKRGSCGVAVTTSSESEMDKAEQILNECGAVDIDEKAESWRKDGWTGPAVGVTGASSTAANMEAGATRKLQEVEEELQVGKRAVAKGGVRIFTRMTEVPVSETVRLREEHADVRRTAVDRPATEADFAAFKEGSIEVRETAEEAVVSKNARVTGEVEVGKTSTEREETVRDTVRKTKVDVEQMAGDSTRGATVAARTGAARAGSANPDPITGEAGSHPVGTGVGAAAGGIAAGAAVGSVAGPVGTVVGAAVGAVAGGAAGKGVAEKIDPTTGKARATPRP